MIKLLQLIFLGHVHKWKTENIDVLSYYHKPTMKWIVTGHRHVLRCEECGEIAQRDVI